MKVRASLIKMLMDCDLSANAQTRKTANEVSEGFAFMAIVGETGAMVARVEAGCGIFWAQEEYGHFESWTGAQAFAAMLNQFHGIDVLEARQIVVSAILSSVCLEQIH